MDTVDVLVVGAGPAGMSAALDLAQRGLQVRLIDKYRRTALHSYALALHPDTLRLLDRLGIVRALIDCGRPLDKIDLRDGPDLAATIDVSSVGGDFPFALAVPQAVLESALEQALAQHGVDVLWDHQLLMFEEADDHVVAVVSESPRGGGEAEMRTGRLVARFLVGADGSDSLVRRLLSITSDPVGEPETYGLAEIERPADPADRLTVVLGDNSTDVFWPLADSLARWSVRLESDQPETIHSTTLQGEILKRAPWFHAEPWSARWVSGVTFEPRLARSFGRGRVWLAGDAARVSSPIGVQGMNVGMREACDLTRRLARILRDDASPELLLEYNDERSHEWKALLGVERPLMRLEASAEWTHRLGERLVATLPSSGRDLNLLLEQVGLRLS